MNRTRAVPIAWVTAVLIAMAALHEAVRGMFQRTVSFEPLGYLVFGMLLVASLVGLVLIVRPAIETGSSVVRSANSPDSSPSVRRSRWQQPGSSTTQLRRSSEPSSEPGAVANAGCRRGEVDLEYTDCGGLEQTPQRMSGRSARVSPCDGPSTAAQNV
jgi:hypothetical protein